LEDLLANVAYPVNATRWNGPLEFPKPGHRVAPNRSETMKLMIVIAASVASAALVTPTVTQGQSKTETPKTQVAAIGAVNGVSA
jgi:hypothetical protein